MGHNGKLVVSVCIRVSFFRLKKLTLVQQACFEPPPRLKYTGNWYVFYLPGTEGMLIRMVGYLTSRISSNAER